MAIAWHDMTALAELTTGLNTPPTDSADHQVTMQHKFGTALIWRDSGNPTEQVRRKWGRM